MSFSRRGGARVGAGRPKKRVRGPSHATRPALSGREPVHVTLRVLEHVYNLRTRRCFEVVFAVMVACCQTAGFRVVSLTVQGHHLHLLVEAANAAALSRGIQAIASRLAKGLNALMGRRGQVFQRFHARPLRTPREVRAAMAYIAKNTTKHAAQVGRRLPAGYRDPYTVGYFGARSLAPDGTAGMVAVPETWLLLEGWKRGVAATPAHRSVRSTPSVGASPSGVLALFATPSGAAATSGPAKVRSDERDRAPARRRLLAAA